MYLLIIIILSALSIYGLHALVCKLCEISLNRNIHQVQDHIIKHGNEFYKNKFVGGSYNHVNQKRNRIQGTRINHFLMPIVFCRLCMTSVWGSIFYWGWGWILGGATVTAWIPSLFVIAGCVVFLVNQEKNY